MARSSIALRTANRPEPLQVLRLDGQESLSRPYRFDIVIECKGDARVDDLLGVDAQLTLDESSATPRVLAGFLERARLGAPRADGARLARLRLRPHWWRLSLRRTSRVFQELSTLEIVALVARAHGVPVLGALLSEPRRRVYCVQHQETDLAFVERILADEGLVYHLGEPVDGVHPVVLLDHAGRYPSMLGSPRLDLRTVEPGSAIGLELEEHNVTHFEHCGRVTPNRTLQREYDFKRPWTAIGQREVAAFRVEAAEPVASDPSELGASTWYEHHGAYGEDQPILNAEVAHKQVQRKRRNARGASLCRRLAPGVVFELDGDDSAAMGGYAIAELRHIADTQVASTETVYKNRFTAVARDVLHRPPRPPHRVHQSLETATVVGPADESIHTDALGRVKVQFHWDTEGRFNERSSCWLRVSQGWAGAGFGAQLIPRIGMEVIVGFLGGDIDRPIVLGCVENAATLAPFALPDQRTRSGLRTQSVPGTLEQYNELSFEDLSGGEQVRLRAQRDLQVNVLNDSDTTVGHSARVHVGQDLDAVVGGRRTTTVRGRETSRFESDGDSTCVGSWTARVGADLRLDVVASHDLRVGGNVQSDVAGDRLDKTAGDHSVKVGISHSVLVGTPYYPGQADLRSTGAMNIAGERTTVVNAGERLVLQCGDSAIELRPTEIILRSPNIHIAAAKSLTASSDGPSLELTDKAQLFSDELRLLTKNGSLELASETTLRGSAIHLTGNDPKRPTSDPDNPVETQNIKVRLTDENFRAYAGRRFEARAGATVIEGTTGGDGKVELEIPKTATQLELTVWIGDYPTGRRRDFKFRVEEIPAIDLIAGVQTRLKALGYYDGATNGDSIDAPTAAALRAFQRDHDLNVSGQIDDATKAALVERYGH
ncbi:MAG: type VI secretion system tip protein TssI/VgrG [Polyangiaceae bacterium]